MKKYNPTTKKFDIEDDRQPIYETVEKLETAKIYYELTASGLYVKDADVPTANTEIGK